MLMTYRVIVSRPGLGLPPEKGLTRTRGLNPSIEVWAEHLPVLPGPFYGRAPLVGPRNGFGVDPAKMRSAMAQLLKVRGKR